MKMNPQYKKEYADFLRKFVDLKRPLKVVFDATNGPTGMIIKDVFAGSDIEISIINDDIDPDFKAHAPNPLLPGASDGCAKAVRDNNADIGVMADADGDRAVFLDETGELIPSCFITALIARDCEAPFVNDELVYQSLRFTDIIPDKDLVPSRIGAYFIKQRMKEGQYSFGAEYSGHYYFKDFFGLDSGLFATIKALNALSKMNVPLSAWRASYGEHEIITIEIKIEGKDIADIYKKLEERYAAKAKSMDRRDGITFIFDDFWANIRTSNTEPIMRIVAGGKGKIHEGVEEMRKMVTE